MVAEGSKKGTMASPRTLSAPFLALSLLCWWPPRAGAEYPKVTPAGAPAKVPSYDKPGKAGDELIVRCEISQCLQIRACTYTWLLNEFPFS